MRVRIPSNRNGIRPTNELSVLGPACTAEKAKAAKPKPARLSHADQENYKQFDAKLQMVRDRTVGVARGYYNGFFLSGPGGVSKSFTVLKELKRLKIPYRLSNSRMTGRGLFDILTRYPEDIHVLEDVEQLMNDRNALGVLRSALWGQRRGDSGPQERLITWSTHKMRLETLFTGGIIVISNRQLVDLPELQALKTRIPCMHLQPGDNELRALMRHVALKGFEHGGLKMDPVECSEVCRGRSSHIPASCLPRLARCTPGRHRQ